MVNRGAIGHLVAAGCASGLLLLMVAAGIAQIGPAPTDAGPRTVADAVSPPSTAVSNATATRFPVARQIEPIVPPVRVGAAKTAAKAAKVAGRSAAEIKTAGKLKAAAAPIAPLPGRQSLGVGVVPCKVGSCPVVGAVTRVKPKVTAVKSGAAAKTKRTSATELSAKR